MGLLSTTHHHHTKTVSVPYEKNVTVHEYRAATDKSVELLNEFQEKAKLNIIDSIKIENNIINGLVMVFQDGLKTQGIDSYTYHFKFRINGIDFKDKLSLTPTEKQELLIESNYNEHYFHHYLLTAKISEIITKNLMKQLTINE